MQMSDAGDVRSAAWRAPRTTMRTRQRLVRALITEIVVDIDEAAGEIVLVIHWKGGQHSELRVHKPRTGEHGCSTPKQALAVMRSMAGRWSDQDIAASLNRMGMPTGQGKTWTTHRVSSLRRVRGIAIRASAWRSERCHPWRCRRTGAVDAPAKGECSRLAASCIGDVLVGCISIALYDAAIGSVRCRRRRAGLATKPPIARLTWQRIRELQCTLQRRQLGRPKLPFDPRECHNGKDPNTLSLTRPASSVAPN